jgi:hypothetical protein
LPGRLSEKGRRWQEFPAYPVSLITSLTRSPDFPDHRHHPTVIKNMRGLLITRSPDFLRVSASPRVVKTWFLFGCNVLKSKHLSPYPGYLQLGI